jgi:hypothetical protein
MGYGNFNNRLQLTSIIGIGLSQVLDHIPTSVGASAGGKGHYLLWPFFFFRRAAFISAAR